MAYLSTLPTSFKEDLDLLCELSALTHQPKQESFSAYPELDSSDSEDDDDDDDELSELGRQLEDHLNDSHTSAKEQGSDIDSDLSELDDDDDDEDLEALGKQLEEELEDDESQAPCRNQPPRPKRKLPRQEIRLGSFVCIAEVQFEPSPAKKAKFSEPASPPQAASNQPTTSLHHGLLRQLAKSDMAVCQEPSCYKTFFPRGERTAQEQLVRHMASCHKSYQCTSCQQEFGQYNAMRRHSLGCSHRQK